jgi:hypothetical protein
MAQRSDPKNQRFRDSCLDQKNIYTHFERGFGRFGECGPKKVPTSLQIFGKPVRFRGFDVGNRVPDYVVSQLKVEGKNNRPPVFVQSRSTLGICVRLAQ